MNLYPNLTKLSDAEGALRIKAVRSNELWEVNVGFEGSDIRIAAFELTLEQALVQVEMHAADHAKEMGL